MSPVRAPANSAQHLSTPARRSSSIAARFSMIKRFLSMPIISSSPLGTSFWPPSGKAVTTPPSVLIATTQFSPCDPALPLLRTTSLRGPRTSRRCPRRPRPRTRRASKALLPSPSSTCWLTSYVNYSNTRLCPYLRAWRSGYHCTEVESASSTSLCPTSSGTEHFLSRQLAEIYHGSRPGFSARWTCHRTLAQHRGGSYSSVK